MRKKYLLFAVVFICLIAGINAQDWQRVSSVSDLIGRWNGAFVMDVPENPEEMIPKSKIDVRIELNCAASNYELRMIVDLNSFLDNLMEIPEIKTSGLTKELFWMFLAMEIESYEQDQYDFNMLNDEFAIIVTMSGTFDELLINEDVFISADMITLRLVFKEKFSFGLGDEGLDEIILNKM